MVSPLPLFDDAADDQLKTLGSERTLGQAADKNENEKICNTHIKVYSTAVSRIISIQARDILKRHWKREIRGGVVGEKGGGEEVGRMVDRPGDVDLVSGKKDD